MQMIVDQYICDDSLTSHSPRSLKGSSRAMPSLPIRAQCRRVQACSNLNTTIWAASKHGFLLQRFQELQTIPIWCLTCFYVYSCRTPGGSRTFYPYLLRSPSKQ